MNGKILTSLLLLPILAMGIARADAIAPDALVKNVTEDVLGVLRHDRGIQAGDRQRAVSLIESKVAPHFDFDRMTSLAVGRAWRQADPEQRKALSAEFRSLLVRTYANALSAYRDQTVTFKPSSPAPSDGDVTVHSQIDKPGARPIAIDYSLARSEGDWKVFDVAIASVSLVTSYRESFASEIEKGGIGGLLKTLQEKNRHLEAAPASPA